MFTIKELFDDMVLLGTIIEEKGIDTVQFVNGAELEKIEEWETNNNAELPQGYKEFIMLTNGFDYRGTQILPLERILEDTREYSGYYIVGSYIGDGSLLLSDKDGNFYCADHVYGIKKTEFAKFIKDDFIYYMKDTFKENDVELPDNLNTRETEEDKKKREEEKAEMLRKLKELREKKLL